MVQQIACLEKFWYHLNLHFICLSKLRKIFYFVRLINSKNGLFRFLITLYNTGTRQQVNPSKAVGLNVINIGVANLSQTIRTDLANKYLKLIFKLIKWLKVFNFVFFLNRILLLKEEYKEVLRSIYHEESISEYLNVFYSKLIEKLLADQDESNLADLIDNFKNVRSEYESKKLRSISTSSQSSYYIQQADDNQSVYNKK